MSDTLTLDPELRAKAEAHIRDQVALGFADEDEIIEKTLDYFEGQDFDFDALEVHAVQTTRAAIAAHCQAQQTWPAVEWNGSARQRISLTGLEWKKRREVCR